jgi:UDP-2,4-diacetamido-2,4,6-trideoxy-beta-L-altropyranose hydrolase
MNKTVVIRCDGRPDIGLGHVVRCISLAHMLKDDFYIHFFVLSIPKSLEEEIREMGCEITRLEREDEFLKQVRNNQIVVLDGYHFDSEYQKRIKENGASLVCIDDFHNQHFYSDLVINHAPGITESDYQGEGFTSYLLGPKYALLRPPFLEKQSQKIGGMVQRVQHLFVCLGGSDYENITSQIVECMPPHRFQVVIVTGSVYLFDTELREIIERKRSELDVILKNSLTAKEMRNEMQNADLAILPSSGILLEALSLRLPTISGYYTSNQKEMYQNFEKENLIIGIENFNIEKLSHILRHSDLQNKIDELTRLLNHSAIGEGSNEIRNSFKKL